ncbi:MAG TPA: hypothetical protein DCX06_10325 [Opitutae bacterium]|nr:hypothetical protein [Opitutae bacterium]
MNIPQIFVSSLLIAGLSYSVSAGTVLEYTFDTTTDGVTQNGQFQTFGQATASTSEGVLQGRLNSSSPFDAQISLNPGTLTLGGGETWDTIEFRIRQLADNTGTPGAPQAIDYASTLLSVTLSVGGFQNLGLFNTTYYTEVTQADGWSLFTVDLATYLVDNSFAANAEITSSRFDPIGSPAQAGNWVEVDYIAFNSVPEHGTYALLGGLIALGFVAIKRRQ